MINNNMISNRPKTWKTGLVSLVSMTMLVVAFNALSAGEVEHATLNAGDKAPLFTTYTIDGEPFDLKSNLEDKSVVLFFWSFFCGPCREEMPIIQQFHESMKNEPVTFVGVNLDEPPIHMPVKNFLNSSGFSYPIIVNRYGNEDFKIDKLYKVTGTPTLYIVNEEGAITFAHVGRITPDELKKSIIENTGVSGGNS